MALVLAACGGDDDDSSSDPTTAETTESTAAETTDAGDETTAPDDTDAPSTDAPDATESPATDAPDATEAPSTDAPAGDGDSYDVCALLTPEELQTLFGSPFEGSATHQEQTGGDQCVWTNTDAPPVKVVSITVLRQDHLGGAFETADVDLAQLYEDTKTHATDPQDLDLGDKAYTTGQGIYVLLGDTYITFDVTGTSDEAIAGLNSMAELVLGKIG